MTPFEIIILVIFYAFCYGYVYESLRDKDSCENSTVFNVFIAFGAFFAAFYAPMILGLNIAKKLNN